MSDVAMLPIFVVFILYFSSIPIAFALFGSALTYFTFINAGSPVDLLLQKFISSTSSFPLLAVPFFIMAGEIMNYSGISSSLMKMAEVLTGHLRGGLAQVNVMLAVLMGGISGSANADAAMQAKIMVPEMEKRGISRGFSSALVAAASAVCPVIPPGINLIIYALIANVSVAKIFIAGYIPGMLMALCLMIAVNFIARRRNYLPTRDKRAPMKEILVQARHSCWALLLPFAIILGLRYGVFTPTEAGAVAVVFCTFVGFFVYKQLKWHHFPMIIRDSLYASSSVVLLLVSASVFSYYMSWERLPQEITEMLMNVSSNPHVMLMLVNILLLIMGMFLEGGAVLIITAPLLVPVMIQMGVDPIHFGMVMIVNIMIGGVTPPFGSMMFTTCSITKIPVAEFVRESIPFIVALLVSLLIVTYWPWLIMLLPNLI